MKLIILTREDYNALTPSLDKYYIIKDEGYLYQGNEQITYNKFVLQNIEVDLEHSTLRPFTKGKPVSYQGLKVLGHYSDGSTEEITGYTIEPEEGTLIGDEQDTFTATVYYEDKTTSFTVQTSFPNYLCFTANQANSTIALQKKNSTAELKYSTDRENWTEFNSGSTITLTSSSDKVYLKGSSSAASESDYTQFKMTGRISASGSIMSILCDDPDAMELPHGYCCYKMFFQCNLTTAPELPATTLTDSCYSNMFNWCAFLTASTELPATTLAPGCYWEMFYGSMISTPPELPAITLTDSCYYGMFKQSYITKAPDLPATTLAEWCYGEMFNYCTHLTTGPSILPAETLAAHCYHDMFSYSTITTPPELSAINLAESCCYNMFCGASLTTATRLPATTLAEKCYYNMFAECWSLSTLPLLPATDLPYRCYGQMFYGCNVRLSTEQTGAYQTPYRIPAENNTTADRYDAAYDMFVNGPGPLTGTPELNRTYYTSNPVI